MQPRKLLALLVIGIGVGLLSERTNAQNEAPFTIRYPPDGSTVREKVHIRVPLASVPEGGYVSIEVDGNFIVAMAPSATERAAAKPGANIDFVWDTKSPMKVGRGKTINPQDGDHKIQVSLFVPRPSTEGNGNKLAATSSVNVTLSNKVNTDSDITLRYKFADGNAHIYTRNGTTEVSSQDETNTDKPQSYAQKSELVTAVDDKYDNGNAMVRNKLTKLLVRQGTEESIYPSDKLPKSIYEELDPYGHVVYRNNTTASFDQFTTLGIPVSTTLDMPILPQNAIKVGDAWETEGVPLDIPGVAPDKQPKEKVRSTLEGLEWQSGYPTAKIHQHYEGRTAADLTYMGMKIERPQVTFDRDIYVAFRAGLLVKVNRTVSVTGKLLEDATPGMGAAPGMGSGSPYGSSYGSPYGSGSGSGSSGYRPGSSSYNPTTRQYGSGSQNRNPYMPGSSPGYMGYPTGGSGEGGYGDATPPVPIAVRMTIKSNTSTELAPAEEAPAP